MLYQLDTAILVFDSETRLRQINPPAELLLGIARGDLIGRRCSRLPVPRAVKEWIIEGLSEVMLKGKPISTDLVESFPRQSTLRGMFIPVRGEGGVVDGAMLTLLEIKSEGLDSISTVEDHFGHALWRTPGVHVVLEGKELRVKMANSKVKSLLGAKIVSGRTLKELGVEVDDELLDIFEIVRHRSEPIIRLGRATKTSPYRSLGFFRLMVVPILSKTGHNDISIVVTDASEAEERRFAQFANDLHVERTRLRSILDTIPIGIEIVDALSGEWQMNRYGAEIWGSSHQEDLPHDRSAYVAISVRTGKEVGDQDWPLMRALEGESLIPAEEFEIRKFDGSTAFMMVSGAPMIDNRGKVIGAVSAFVDVTEKRMMERRLEKQAWDLERSNAELQQFAYIASHDLKEPLRMISSFLELLVRRYDNKVLDDKAKEYIDYAVDGAVRMQQMINDVLTFSRVDTEGGSFAYVDMNKVLGTTLQDLNVDIDKTGATISSSELPTVKADQMQMILLLENLVGNAIKFHADLPPRIEVYALDRENEWVFCIKDNGIGIPSSQQSNLFQMFQRLHGRNEYPGTGIGLAICKKIVERHGGRIWLESEEGKGSSFFFSLPKDGPGIRPL